MIDCLQLGPAPAEEPCAQLGQPDYPEQSQEECRRYAQLLLKIFGQPPHGAYLTVKQFPHDFGAYREVCVVFDTDVPEAVEYAFTLEDNIPATWQG